MEWSRAVGGECLWCGGWQVSGRSCLLAMLLWGLQEAIGQLASITALPVLKPLFSSLMHKLLQTTVQHSQLASAPPAGAAPDAPGRTPAAVAALVQRRACLMDLALPLLDGPLDVDCFQVCARARVLSRSESMRLLWRTHQPMSSPLEGSACSPMVTHHRKAGWSLTVAGSFSPRRCLTGAVWGDASCAS